MNPRFVFLASIVLASLHDSTLAQSETVLASFDVLTAPDPTAEENGWTANEIKSPNPPGPLGSTYNAGEVAGPAWQINDQLSDLDYNSPSYTIPLSSSELTEMYRSGWEFTFTVRVISGNANLAGYLAWTVSNEHNPGWELGALGRRMGCYLSTVSGNAYMTPDQGALPSPANQILLGPTGDYHTIRAVGQPRSSEVVWFVNGNEVGSFDFALSYPNNAANTNLVTFGSGSSGGINLVANWTSLKLSLAPHQVYHVDQTANGSNDGSTWEHAFTDLQDALRHPALGAGDQVWVAQGTYLPEPPPASSDSDSFILVDGVAVFGGFPNGGGDGTMDARNPDPNTNGTRLSGDLDGNDQPEFGNRDDNSSWVLRVIGPSSGTCLDGFSISGGGRSGEDVGGGMLVDSSLHPSISSAEPVTVTNCSFSENYNLADLGGIGGPSYGAGGGAIHNRGDLSIHSCSFFQNWALLGGAILNLGELLLHESSIHDNHAFLYGGGILGGYLESAIIADLSTGILNVTIAGNSTVDDPDTTSAGGGLLQLGGQLYLINSTVSANTSDCGPGVAFIEGDLISANCVLTGNTLRDDGPPCAEQPFSSDLLLEMADHEFGGGLLLGDQLFDQSGNPIGGPVQALLAPLGNYGGSTKCMPPLPGSPAIEGGLASEPLLIPDQIGNPRPSGPLPDLGAVEAIALGTLGLPSADGDDIPDQLEGPGTAYPHLDPLADDSAVDTDGDGHTDADEIANMTNPLDPGDKFRILSLVPAPGFHPLSNPVFDVTWSCFPGLSYSLENSSSLTFGGPPLFGPATAADFTHSETITLQSVRDFVRARRE
ncbi:choice-of-anchor Q domain-containing protein [Haloferula sp.]|uniref:choice-of-anchor Q domain-containing protein n=1 Tax=Haloferula sp. TaxID=2497595 RepID=UPI0032A0FE6C